MGDWLDFAVWLENDYGRASAAVTQACELAEPSRTTASQLDYNIRRVLIEALEAERDACRRDEKETK